MGQKRVSLWRSLAYISILISVLVNPLLILASDKEATVSAEIEITVTPTIEVIPTKEASPTATPTIEITPTEVATPTATLTPEFTVTPVPTKEISEVSPTMAPTPLPTVTPTKVLITGVIETVIRENNESRTDLLNPVLSTDKADYQPTEIVIISGKKFLPNTAYVLKITADNLNVSYSISTDNTGSFIYSYQLDGIYRPGYLIESLDTDNKVIASTTFTDLPAENYLFFSEYIEGSSYNKAIEIYNPTNLAIGLSGYSVKIYIDGAGSAATTIALSQTINANDVYVVCNSRANVLVLSQCDLTTGSLDFNGNDAVALQNGPNTVDVIGQIGVDPGTEWGNGLTSTADNTLVRKCGISQGDTNGADIFNPATQWDGYAADTFGYLGSHTINCFQPDSDGDSVPDSTDICPTVANPGQEDADGDGKGDACDNCVNAVNPNQEDSDSDGIGNVCDTYNCLYQGAEVCGDGIDNNCDGFVDEACDDTIAPITTSNAGSYTFGTWTNGNVNMGLICSDNSSGCKNTYWCDDGGAVICIPGISGLNFQTNVFNFLFDTEGTWYLRYQSDDNQENLEITQTRIIKIDKTAPTATVNYSTTNLTNQDVVATLNPSESVTVINNGGLANHTFTNNGDFTFGFVDIAGNTGNIMASVDNIDKTPPVVNFVDPTPDDNTVLNLNYADIEVKALDASKCWIKKSMVLNGDFENQNLAGWESGGAASWTVDCTNKYAGSCSAKSGYLGNQDNVETWLKQSISLANNGDLNFWWKVESENSFDYLRFYIDDIEKNNISGSKDWQQISYSVSAGNHIIKLNYTKDYSVTRDPDSGWIDEASINEAGEGIEMTKGENDNFYGRMENMINGSHSYKVRCQDVAGNVGFSSERQIIINVESVTPTPTPTNTPTLSFAPAELQTGEPTSTPKLTPTIVKDSCQDEAPGSAPHLLSAEKSGFDEVILKWEKADDPVSYYLLAYGYKSEEMLFGNPNIGNSDTTEYTVKSLSGGKKYYFKIRAGNGCMPGSFSNELSVDMGGQKTTGGTVSPDFQENVLGVEETKTDVTEENIINSSQYPWWRVIYWAGSGLGLLVLSYLVLKKRED